MAFIRHAENRDLAPSRMPRHDFLDVARVDVHPPGHDEVLLPVDQAQVTFLIDAAQVAGVQPPVDYGLRREVVAAPVARHQQRAPSQDLADFADGGVLPFGSGDAHFVEGERRPDGVEVRAESAAIEAYLRRGGSLLAMFDLGFVLEGRLAELVGQLGVGLPQEAVVDPLSHYAGDREMVAITGYETGPLTRNLSMTFFPGVRPLVPRTPAAGVAITPLFASSRDSYTRAVRAAGVREVEPAAKAALAPSGPGPRLLAAMAEGRLPGADAGAPPLRAVIVGDGDFASNSFLPFLANSDLVLSMVRWLVREERATGVASRIPVPPMILLSGTQMRTIFLTVEVLLPLAVFALAILMWWRRR